MANKTSPHILGTAANLLGFCLIVISSLHITRKSQNNLIDEITSIIALLLTLSSIFSFTSMKARTIEKEGFLEKMADGFFFAALVGIFAIILFLTIKLWNN